MPPKKGTRQCHETLKSKRARNAVPTLMPLLCCIWGSQRVLIKLTYIYVAPVLQVGVPFRQLSAASSSDLDLPNSRLTIPGILKAEIRGEQDCSWNKEDFM